MEPLFFDSPADLRAWFEANHETEREMWAGYWKAGTGRVSPSWSESVDQALCFGWIDGIRKSLGRESYTNRFTPRKPKSNWSAVNIAKVERLTAEGLMWPAGLRAFAAREDAKSGVYTYEQRHLVELPAEFAARLAANENAARWFEKAPAGYRKMALYHVMSAKRDETRLRRLEELIATAAEGKRLRQFAR
ncbi:MAG: YdeI/OmpD-associated family protein [Thermoflexaceae bacterium]|nr:YdeI/OmpD-associated family protein [Thermoflexaceae bacterium]